jgi:peptidoglycan/LPS O-acetylase OafA/YrhL
MQKKTVGQAGGAENEVPFGARSSALDGIRGIAIILVIAFHTLLVSQTSSPLVKFWYATWGLSWAGVDLFFTLSGFLITGILLDSKGQPGYFRNFYARRSLRIMPLYYVVLIFSLVLVPLVAHGHLPAMFQNLQRNQLWLWLYVQNFLMMRGPHQLPGFGHFWSLAVEEQFYWVWPLVVLALPRKWLLRLSLAICAAEPLIRFLLLQDGFSGWAVRQLTFSRIDSLLYGAIGAILVRQATSFREHGRWLLAACIPSLGVLGYLIFRDGYVQYENPTTVIFGYSALAMLALTLIYYSYFDRGIVARILSAPILRLFGRHSYALYVFHPMIDAWWTLKYPPEVGTHNVPQAMAHFAVVFFPSCILAWISWIAIERPFLRMKRWFEYRDPATENKRTPERSRRIESRHVQESAN